MKKAFSIVSSFAYYPLGVRLFHNLKKFHPEIDVFLLLCEEPSEKHKLKVPFGLNILTLDKVDSDYKNRWMNKQLHVAGAARILVVDYLINNGYDKVVYLDCDVNVFRPINYLFDLMDNNDFIAAPHCIDPVPLDGNVPHLWNMRGMGTFNSSLFACKNTKQARDFMTWWKEFTVRYNRMDSIHFFFAEQGWLDFSICFMDKCHVLRHPGYNGGWYNICERDLRKVDGIWMAKDEPLYTYHFSGYKKHKDTLFTPDNLRYVFAGSPLEELYREYEEDNNKYLEYKI